MEATNYTKSFGERVNDSVVLTKFFSPYILKSVAGMIFALFIPLLIAFFAPLQALVPIAIVFPVLFISMINTPIIVSSFKRTSIIKRVGITRISKLNFFGTLITLNSLIGLGISLLVMLLALTDVNILGVENPFQAGNIKWGSYFIQILVMSISFTSIGIFMGIIFKSPALTSLFGVLVLLLSLILSPMGLELLLMLSGGYGSFPLTFGNIIAVTRYLTPWTFGVSGIYEAVTGTATMLTTLTNVVASVGITAIAVTSLVVFVDFNKTR